MTKNISFFSLLFLSIQIMSCSKYRKYEGTYQMGDRSGMKDVFEVRFNNDSILIGEIHSVHEKTDRPSKKRIYFNSFPNAFICDTIEVKSGDTLTYYMHGNGVMITDYLKNDTLHKNYFYKKKNNFRIRLGSNSFIRF